MPSPFRGYASGGAVTTRSMTPNKDGEQAVAGNFTWMATIDETDTGGGNALLVCYIAVA